jgi:hypothetical protein
MEGLPRSETAEDDAFDLGNRAGGNPGHVIHAVASPANFLTWLNAGPDSLPQVATHTERPFLRTACCGSRHSGASFLASRLVVRTGRTWLRCTLFRVREVRFQRALSGRHLIATAVLAWDKPAPCYWRRGRPDGRRKRTSDQLNGEHGVIRASLIFMCKRRNK